MYLQSRFDPASRVQCVGFVVASCFRLVQSEDYVAV